MDALEKALVDLHAELHASRADTLSAQRESADLRGQLERAQLERKRAEERSAALAAELERAQGALAAMAARERARDERDGEKEEEGPVTAEGLVRLAGAQAFASEAFETISVRSCSNSNRSSHRAEQRPSSRSGVKIPILTVSCVLVIGYRNTPGPPLVARRPGRAPLHAQGDGIHLRGVFQSGGGGGRRRCGGCGGRHRCVVKAP